MIGQRRKLIGHQCVELIASRLCGLFRVERINRFEFFVTVNRRTLAGETGRVFVQCDNILNIEAEQWR